jgi:hypothetical protein
MPSRGSKALAKEQLGRCYAAEAEAHRDSRTGGILEGMLRVQGARARLILLDDRPASHSTNCFNRPTTIPTSLIQCHPSPSSVRYDQFMVCQQFFIPSTSPQQSPLDALDSGSHKSAIVTCNKLLKKHPKNDHLKVFVL